MAFYKQIVSKAEGKPKKRTGLSSPPRASSVSRTASPVNLKQSCWDAILYALSLHRAAEKQQLCTNCSTTRGESGRQPRLSKWKLASGGGMSFTSSPTDTSLQLGAFPLLNEFTCAFQVLFHLPYVQHMGSSMQLNVLSSSGFTLWKKYCSVQFLKLLAAVQMH